MKNLSLCFCYFALVQNLLHAEDGKKTDSEPATVQSVDLQRYIGVWYEISKIPNSFQKKCAHSTTATYTIRDDGSITVINRCIEEDGSENKAEGVARVVDRTTNSKLEVSFVKIFGLRLFWGDYWIIGLDENYDYAVVGSPNRKYGWILCRQKQLAEEKLAKINAILKQQGFNPQDFVSTVQK